MSQIPTMWMNPLFLSAYASCDDQENKEDCQALAKEYGRALQNGTFSGSFRDYIFEYGVIQNLDGVEITPDKENNQKDERISSAKKWIIISVSIAVLSLLVYLTFKKLSK